MGESQNEQIGYKDIFGQKEYMKMIVAALVNRFGDSVDAIASTWIVYEITGSAAWSAIVYGINKIPSILITPFAGAWVEGRNKKNIMVITDIIRALCVAIVATAYLFGVLNAGILILTTLIISTAEAFRSPANTAFTPRVLEKRYYEYGLSLMSTLCSVVELIGTAVAAGIIALIGTAGAIYVDMTTFILSAIIILNVSANEEKVDKKKMNTKEYMRTFTDGLIYVKRDRIVLFFCIIAIFLNAILVPFNSLQAPLTSEILSGGAEVLSVLGITLTLGMMIGTAVYPMLGKFINSKGYLGFCCWGIGLYYIGFVVCKPLYVSKIFMYSYVALSSFLCGIVIAVFMTFLNVEFVKRTKEEYLARAAGIMGALSVASVPIASLLVSALAVVITTEYLFVFAGVLAIAICPFLVRNKAFKEEGEVEQIQI